MRQATSKGSRNLYGHFAILMTTFCFPPASTPPRSFYIISVFSPSGPHNGPPSPGSCSGQTHAAREDAVVVR